MKRLLLVGAGHAHAAVLQSLAARPMRGVDITMVSPDAAVPSSAMVPGWLAGHYRWDQCCVDFPALCRRADVRFVAGQVDALEPHGSRLRLAGGGMLDYDWLSVNIGATMAAPAGGGQVIALRPLASLRQPWQALIAQMARAQPGAQCRILVAGAGAAGVECALAIEHRLRRSAPHVRFSFAIASGGPDMLRDIAPGAARLLGRLLTQRGIEVLPRFRVVHCDGVAAVAADGRRHLADHVFWAGGAGAHGWPRQARLQTDEAGFIRVDATLRSPSHSNVFAAGDCASLQPPLPKAGVYAVRMGAVLAHNLRAACSGAALRRYRPQRRFLTLVGTGDADAVASWGGLSWRAPWVWRWKCRLDRAYQLRHS